MNFLMPVPLHALADHRAVDDVQGREQGRRAIGLCPITRRPDHPEARSPGGMSAQLTRRTSSCVIVPARPRFIGSPGPRRSIDRRPFGKRIIRLLTDDGCGRAPADVS